MRYAHYENPSLWPESLWRSQNADVMYQGLPLMYWVIVTSNVKKNCANIVYNLKTLGEEWQELKHLV